MFCFSVYIFISLSQLDKSMMVPSISPFPVLLKHKAVRGLLPVNTWGCSFWTIVCWEQIKEILAVFVRFVFQVHFFIFHTVLLPNMICCEFCIFCVCNCVCSGFCRDNRCLEFCSMFKRCIWRTSNPLKKKKKKKTRYIKDGVDWKLGLNQPQCYTTIAPEARGFWKCFAAWFRHCRSSHAHTDWSVSVTHGLF